VIKQASIIPKRRVATKPSRAEKERRREAKKRRGNVKRLRGSRDFD
jgi:ribosome-associated protein